MNRYVLAKLVQWAGPSGLAGRKRLQKVVYFLQHLGCPCEAEYELHHYGPYSRDVAEACDALIAGDLLKELPTAGCGYVTFHYTLGDEGPDAVQYTEGRLPDLKGSVAEFEELGTKLLETDTRVLELGSTILFCLASLRKAGAGTDWELAITRACEFKRIDRDADTDLPAAIELAQEIDARSPQGVAPS